MNKKILIVRESRTPNVLHSELIPGFLLCAKAEECDLYPYLKLRAARRRLDGIQSDVIRFYARK